MGFQSTGGSGATVFTGLTDAPGAYAGYGEYDVRVKAAEDGLEFYDAASSGDVVGPSSATDNAFAQYDLTTGKLLKNSALTLIGGDLTGMTTLTVPNSGLHILDTNASHDLIIKPGSDLTGDRIFTLTTGDAARTLSMSGDVTIPAAFTIAGGANALTLTLSGATNVTLPLSGTVATLSNTLDQFGVPVGSVSMNSQLITNLAEPVSSADAATKSYADAIASGLLVKTSCRVATTANLAATYAGTPAFTLTATGNGAISVDGIALSLNDRVLVKDQTTGSENGIYYVTTVGTAGTPYVITRTTDADTSAEIGSGTYSFVSQGTVNAATGFILTTADPITLDTTALSFTQFSAAQNYVAGSGLALTSLTFSVGAGTGITVNADSIEVDFAAVQAKDTTLDALAAYSTNGLLTQTAADTFTGRTITAGIGVAVTNGNGVSGNPTIAVDINGLTADATPDSAADYTMTYDDSAGTNKKVKIGDLASVLSATWMRWRQIGTSPLEIWYNQAISASIYTTTALVANTLYAYPWYSGRGATADRLAVRVTTAGAAGTRVSIALYTNTSETVMYPDALLVSGEDLACDSTGVKTETISQLLSPDTLYWLVVLSSGAPTLRAITPYSSPNILGSPSTITYTTGISTVAYGYAALPATYPAGSTVITNNPVGGYVRYSA